MNSDGVGNSPYTATLVFSESIVRRATFAFWRRTVGPVFPLLLAALAAYVAYQASHGDRSWGLGVLGAVVFGGLLFLPALFFVHYRNGQQKLRDMGDMQAKIEACGDGFTVSSGIGSSTLRWSSVQAVWRFDGFWLVLFSKAQFMTLPLGDMAPEMRAFIIDRVAASGGKVDQLPPSERCGGCAKRDRMNSCERH